MKKLHAPKAQFLSSPFVSGFTDIENESSDLIIGKSDKIEDVFTTSYPEYVKVLCELEPESIFPDVTISAGYKLTKDGESKLMNYAIYDGKSLPLDKLVSKISIRFVDFLGYSNPPWRDLLTSNPIIYCKTFKIQERSRRIDNFLDSSMSQSGILHTKSAAHYLGGYYFPGIKLSDIQPCLFYLGTGIQGKEYINLLTAKEAIQNRAVKLAPDVEASGLTTLADNVASGVITLRFQDQTYKSITSTKETLLSNVCQILFRKEF